MLKSYLYEGMLKHRRFHPRDHAFKYRLYMAYLDLDELDHACPKEWIRRERFAWTSFLRSDHFGNPRERLSESIKKLVYSKTGISVNGPIRLLTQLRTWGYYFSPLNMYYCFEADGTTLIAIVAEVSNTPWNEKHLYVLWEGNQLSSGNALKYRHQKAFHVSPFMSMDHIYDWSIGIPREKLCVGIRSIHQNQVLFHAGLELQRRALNRATLRRMQIRYPLLTIQIVTAIYHQAFRLWKKKLPFYPHPKTAQNV
ncbi:MAG: DUF1365 domain-containing protein [Planctomycetota bacterium]|nr:DUF1365 domain-containing protein [Planctomycetota bacterium]